MMAHTRENEMAIRNHIIEIRKHVEEQEATIGKTAMELFDAIEGHILFYYDGIGDDKLFPLLDAIKKHIKEQDAVIAAFCAKGEYLLKAYENQDMIAIKGMVSFRQIIKNANRLKKNEATNEKSSEM